MVFPSRLPTLTSLSVAVAAALGLGALAPTAQAAPAPAAAESRVALTYSRADSGAARALKDRVVATSGTRVVVRPLLNDVLPAGARFTARLTGLPEGVSAKQRGKRLVFRSSTEVSARVVVRYRVVGSRLRSRVVVVLRPAAAPELASPTGTAAPAVPASPVPPTVAPLAPAPTTPDTPAPTPTVPDTAGPTPTGPAGNDPFTALVLTLPVAAEVRTGYDRDLFDHWNAGLFSDGCDTRREVLRSEALVGSGLVVGPGCSFSGGTWFSYYDGVATTDSSTFDIDHMVPLAEAWDSGAHAWDDATREAYANDQGEPRALVAVSASSNRSKSDRDPAEWLPPLEVCRYLADWTVVKARWDLSVDAAEQQTLLTHAPGCAGSVDLTVVER